MHTMWWFSNIEETNTHTMWWFSNSGAVWYIYLKIENMCLKTCVEICVDKKICENTCNII